MDHLSPTPQAVRVGLDLVVAGRHAEAVEHLAALAGGAWGDDAESTRLRALVLDGLGRARLALGDGVGSVAALRDAVGLLGAATRTPSPEAAALLPLRCRLLQNLCFALSETGATAECTAVGEEAARLAETVFGPMSPELAGALLRLSAAPYRQRDLAAAEALIRRARAIWEAQPGAAPQEVGTCLNNLGRIYEERGDMAAGIAFHREAVAFRRPLPDRGDLAFSLGNLGVALAQDGQWSEALGTLEEALGIYAALGRGESPEARGYAANLEICRRALAAETS